MKEIIICEQECTGCGCCVSVCAHHAVQLVKKDGFYRPQIDSSLCVACGHCQKTCPQNGQPLQTPLMALYAGFAKEDATRASCSSGGMFGLLAEYFILHKNAVIASVAYNERLEAVFGMAEHIKDLEKFKKSKYVQANPGEIYREILQLLKNGRTVLFAGMPCQTAAVKTICRNYEDNLFCIDYICHGIPSPEIWDKFVAGIERKSGKKLIHVDFRNKAEKWNWNNSAIQFCFKDGSVQNVEANSVVYYRAFLENMTIQKSCFSCQYKGGHSWADLTLGDFWEIERTMTAFSDNNHLEQGVSAICVNSAKGEQMLIEIKDQMICEESDMEKLIFGNPCYLSSANYPRHQERYIKWLLLSNDINIEAHLHQVLRYCAIRKRIVFQIRQLVKKYDWFK